MSDKWKYLLIAILIIGVCYAVFGLLFPALGLLPIKSASERELQRSFDEHRARGEALEAGLRDSLEFAERTIAEAERDAERYRQFEENYRAATEEIGRLGEDNSRLEELLSGAAAGSEELGRAITDALGRSKQIERIIREHRKRDVEDD